MFLLIGSRFASCIILQNFDVGLLGFEPNSLSVLHVVDMLLLVQDYYIYRESVRFPYGFTEL